MIKVIAGVFGFCGQAVDFRHDPPLFEQRSYRNNDLLSELLAYSALCGSPKDGGSDGRGVGFYFRNVTELILFGVRGKNARTLAPGRSQVNLLATRKREHSRKPDEQYDIIEACSSGPYLELFARGTRKGWATWGNQADDGYQPSWKTYAYHSKAGIAAAE